MILQIIESSKSISSVSSMTCQCWGVPREDKGTTLVWVEEDGRKGNRNWGPLVW